MATDPHSFMDRLVGASFSLLVAGVTVFIAVQLIEAVWEALVVILGTALFAVITFAVLRSRRGGW